MIDDLRTAEYVTRTLGGVRGALRQFLAEPSTRLGVRFFFFGCNNSFCGCNISFCSYNISFCGCNISFCGYNISFCGCNISFFGCNISFFDCNISFCGYNISFCGYNISFCGCNNSKSDCYILFSACSKSKRDLCFSYATTYNLVDAFLSFKVLHETDAQRSAACSQWRCTNTKPLQI